jgi:hypothetical protein
MGHAAGPGRAIIDLTGFLGERDQFFTVATGTSVDATSSSGTLATRVIRARSLGIIETLSRRLIASAPALAMAMV